MAIREQCGVYGISCQHSHAFTGTAHARSTIINLKPLQNHPSMDFDFTPLNESFSPMFYQRPLEDLMEKWNQCSLASRQQAALDLVVSWVAYQLTCNDLPKGRDTSSV